ncbi:ABC-type nitrate/sulfonate/bicarbonate transport system permease component [Paenibacillus phyllosphaerae]|uniref:ABC-type nitrate/sulfonate/bicarbonate transport system permease component n=1 Tax=Paenibacillus phyllosphaerae TaxID=274593 RepID=A0A7W5FLU4_9BACL|nr:ABC transporter permease [Paenibacillus phyllosphaerae]MBB3109334.1 ABC-type nitrate/sulfonate/bicarbonate transport system permease component [Paenibacillus phyllosphaerae]
MASKGKFHLIWPPAAVMAGLLLIWQIVTSTFNIEEWILPSPYAIGTEMQEAWPRLMEHTAATIRITLLGFGAGTAAGFVLAALLHFIPGARTALYPLLVLTQNIPLIVLGDLLVIWFGFGLMPKLILLVLVCFFPVCVSMLTGLRQADEKLVTYMRMIGASRSQLFWRLELPGSLSHLFTGLKIAASYCVISAIYAETIGSNVGLGVFIRLASNGWETSRVFAGIIMIVALSLLLFGLIAGIERLTLRWQVREEAAGQ